MLIVLALSLSVVSVALLFGMYQTYQIDKELYELEKQEPDYVEGFTNIPGPM